MADPSERRGRTRRPTATGPGRLPGRGPRLALFSWPLLLLALTVVSYWPALHAGFIWDDDDYVTRNPTLSSLEGLRRIWFEPGAVPQYYPLVHTTFWIERHLWGLRPAGYHLVNILLHALASILLWLVLRRLRIPGSGIAAAVFAVHPVQVESVAWVTERKNVLSGVFYMATLLAWFRFSDPDGATIPGSEAPGRDRRFYALAALLFAGGLLSKSVVGSLPFALLLLAWWKTGRVDARGLLRLLPFLVLALALGSVTIWMERHHVQAQGKEWDLTLLERILVAGRAFWFYLQKLVWPAHLAFIYPKWRIDPSAVGQWLFPAAAAALLVALWRWRRRLGRAPLAAALFYGVTILPALGFINVYPMMYTFVADHYQYLACLGLMVAVSGGLAAWGARRSSRRPFRRPVTLGGAVIVALLALLAFQRARAFRDPETLWRATLNENAGAWMAHHNLGKLYDEQGRTEAAIAQYRMALAIRPDLDNSLYNLANDLAAQGRTEEALATYERALQVNPTFVEAHNNIGNLLYRSGRGAEAMRHYRRAVELVPGYAPARRNLAFALADSGRTAEAIVQLRAAVRSEPGDAATLNRLAWLLATSSDPADRDASEAIRLAARACSLGGSGSPGYLLTLAAAYAEADSFEQAVRTTTRARELALRSGRPELAGRCDALLHQFRAALAAR